MSDNKVPADPMNERFAKVMTIVGWTGLVVMALFGFLYLFGLNSYIPADVVVDHWGAPASEFWENTKGIEVNGYSWFLTNLGKMDCISTLGVAALALAPLLSVIAIIRRAPQKFYVFLMIVISLELIFAVVRPLIMAGGE